MIICDILETVPTKIPTLSPSCILYCTRFGKLAFSCYVCLFSVHLIQFSSSLLTICIVGNETCTSTVEVLSFKAHFWSLSLLKVLIPAMSGAQDTIVQATMDTIVNQEAHSHRHDREHGFARHKHVFDMEHMEFALFSAIVGIGTKEGYASLIFIFHLFSVDSEWDITDYRI
jgi:hypothetical protein